MVGSNGIEQPKDRTDDNQEPAELSHLWRLLISLTS
jgi:hypothetical protein